MQKPGNIAKSIAAISANMTRVQKEIEAKNFTGKSGGSLVEVVMNGRGEPVSLTIDPSVMSEDAGTVSDLVLAALGSAYNAKERFAKEKLKSATVGILPMGFKLPGLG